MHFVNCCGKPEIIEDQHVVVGGNVGMDELRVQRWVRDWSGLGLAAVE